MDAVLTEMICAFVDVAFYILLCFLSNSLIFVFFPDVFIFFSNLCLVSLFLMVLEVNRLCFSIMIVVRL